MSTKRGTHHRRSRRQYGRTTARLGYSFTFACASKMSELPEARKRSHDLLIKLTGRHRRGGIEWVTWPAHEAPGIVAGVPNPEMWQDHLAFLKVNPRGYLVMARCKSTPIQPVLDGGPAE